MTEIGPGHKVMRVLQPYWNDYPSNAVPILIGVLEKFVYHTMLLH